MEKYSWNFNESAEVWYNDAYETVDECILAARNTAFEEGDEFYETVYIGENELFCPCVNADFVLEQIIEDAYEFCGEASEAWDAYDYKKHDELEELSNALTMVVDDWLKKYKREPYFWRVKNVKAYPLYERSGENG